MNFLWFGFSLIFCFISCNNTAKNPEVASRIKLFDGNSLKNWRGDLRIWTVDSGCIVGKTTPDTQIKLNTFLIYEHSFSNFELLFKYKIINGNSGVQYRSKVLDEAKFVVGGYQADIEAGVNHSGILYEERGRGILAKRGEKVIIDENGTKSANQFADSDSIQRMILMEDWNEYRVVAKGNHLQHFINQNKTIDVIDNDPLHKADSGKIALQVHTGPEMVVYFKDIWIRPLE